MFRRLLLCACALAALPALAHASEDYDPVNVRLVGPPVVAVAGLPVTATVRVSLDQAGEVTGLRLDGAGWDVRFDTPPAARIAVAKAGFVDLRFTGVAGDPTVPLALRFRVLGRDYAVPLHLSAAAVAAAVTPRPLLAVPPDLAIAPVPALRTAAPGPAKPLPADEVLTPAPPDRPVPERMQPSGAQASRNITVDGGFFYRRKDGLVRGVDAMTVQVWDEDGGTDQYLGSGLTDTQGHFHFTVNWTDTEANPDLYLLFLTTNDQVTVVTGDEYHALYAWISAVAWEFTGTYKDWGGGMPAGDDWNPALHQLVNFTRDYRWYDDRDCPPLPVTVYWPVEGAKGYTTSAGISMGPNDWGWKEGTYGHEYGHWWERQYDNLGGFTYCNGMGDPADTTQGGCTHWAWCWEHQPVPMMEGFSNWVGNAQLLYNVSVYGDTALFNYNWDYIRTCNETPGELSDYPESTDGFICALMTDLWDTNNEDDPLSPGTYKDRMSVSQMAVLDCIRFDNPYTPLDFLAHFRARNPAYTELLWETAKNCMLDPDTQPPDRVTNLRSPSHPVSTSRTDATVYMLWDRAADEWSGVDAYAITTTHTPLIPSAIVTVGNVTSYTTPPLAAGTWYVNIRSRDRAGHWSQLYEHYGPIIILPPNPTDLVPITWIDWDYPVVPRPDGHTTTAPPAPTAPLPGNTASTWFNAVVRNDGDIDTPSGSVTRCYVDGDTLWSTAVGVVPAISQWLIRNEGPMSIAGGRHTFEARHDDGDAVPEDDETNNNWAKQWIWSPVTIAAGGTVTRRSPPDPQGGWDAIPSGDTKYYNCDGLHIAYPVTYPAFNAVCVQPGDPDDDYDCRLHFPTAAADTGFGSYRALSARGAGCVDAVIVNHANVPSPHSWDVGVLALHGAGGDYRARYLTGSTMNFGDSIAVTLAAGEMMALRAFDPGPDTGYVSIVARLVKGVGPLHLAWFDRTFTLGTLDNRDGYALVDGPAPVRIDTYLDGAGWNGIALYRDPKDGKDTVTVVLQIEDTYCDLEPYAKSGWYSPLVPRPALDGTVISVPLPDTLLGDVASTYLNYGLINHGMHPVPVHAPIRVLRDGVTMASLVGDILSAGSRELENPRTAYTVPAGRHTLSYHLDIDEEIAEIDESNNVYGEQYVWGPVALSARVPVTRAAPPDRTGGWAYITGDPDGIYFDCDGLRTPTFSSASLPHGYWAGIAVMPGDTSNVDLRLHEVSKGAQAGFAANLGVSYWGPGLSDFMLVNFHHTAFRAFDAGVLRPSGEQPYTAEVMTSTWRGTNPSGVFGPYSLTAQHLFQLHDFGLARGTYYIDLIDHGGGVDWGLSLHRGDLAVVNKSAVLGGGVAWAAAAGHGESIVVTVADSGSYCLAVWKVGSADLAKSGSYYLQFRAGGTGLDMPVVTRTSLGGAYPNPFGSEARVRYELAREADVALEVYDLHGARVNVLVAERRPAGRHEAVWNGTDHSRQPVSPGVYFIRFTADGVTATRRIVRLD
jgi:hypothetical protein